MKIKRVLPLMLAVLLLPVWGFADIVKDETVYALLSPTGSLEEIYVVTHIDTPEAGEYIDRGLYTSLSAMTATVAPKIDGDTVTWSLDADPAGFYALGVPQDAVLPLLVSIEYALDGEAAEPADLIGRAGRVTIALHISGNQGAPKSPRNALMSQVQVPLSLNHAWNIDAPGAASALVGQTQTLTYTVLPGQSGDFTLSFDTDAFQMDTISIAAMPMDIASLLGDELGALLSSGTALADGAGEIAGGQAQLSAGVDAYVQGVDDALAQLEEAMGTILKGLEENLALLPDATKAIFGPMLSPLTDGLTQYSAGISDARGQLASGGVTLAGGAADLATGTAAFVAGLDGVSGLLAQYARGDEDTALESFVSAGQPVRSLQFVYRTKALTPPAQATTQVEAEGTKTLWERITALFQ